MTRHVMNLMAYCVCPPWDIQYLTPQLVEEWTGRNFFRIISIILNNQIKNLITNDIKIDPDVKRLIK